MIGEFKDVVFLVMKVELICFIGFVVVGGVGGIENVDLIICIVF